MEESTSKDFKIFFNSNAKYNFYFMLALAIASNCILVSILLGNTPVIRSLSGWMDIAGVVAILGVYFLIQIATWANWVSYRYYKKGIPYVEVIGDSLIVRGWTKERVIPIPRIEKVIIYKYLAVRHQHRGTAVYLRTQDGSEEYINFEDTERAYLLSLEKGFRSLGVPNVEKLGILRLFWWDGLPKKVRLGK